MRILAEETCCLAIDYQERILPVMAELDLLMKNSVKLLNGMGMLGIPVMLTAQYIKGLGAVAQEIVQAAGTDKYLEKTSFSIYGEETIRKDLENRKDKTGNHCKNVIICGIETHICVLQSIIDLKEAGYRPVLVEDCVSSRNLHDKKIAVSRAAAEGAVITTLESLLFELTVHAEHPKFKQVSALIK